MSAGQHRAPRSQINGSPPPHPTPSRAATPPTPSIVARAHRVHAPRAALTRTRHHRTPSQATRPPRQRHDEGKVAFKPPIRWTPPAKTRSRELSTNAQPRFAPTYALALANHVPCRLPPQRDGRLKSQPTLANSGPFSSSACTASTAHSNSPPPNLTPSRDGIARARPG